MELPFTIVFEPPSRRELRALLRMRGYWAAGLIIALTIGIAYLLANVAHADAVASGTGVTLSISSRPPGAIARVDGRERGLTPLSVLVDPGAHTVALQDATALDAQYRVDVSGAGASLDAVMWRRQAEVTHLRPALPGAVLADARFLDDGELGLTIELPTDHELQAWRLEPTTGMLQPALLAVAGPRLVLAPDGHHLAYLGPEVGPPLSSNSGETRATPPIDTVWLVDAASRVEPPRGWSAPLEASEQLMDLSWSPHAGRLLVASNQRLDGGASQSRMWMLDADSLQATPALAIPSAIVAGSESWSPDGEQVAFIAHAASVNALCLLGTDGSFRYVADLDQTSAPPLPYPPLVWSADGTRMLFVAPRQHPPGAAFGWFQSDARHALFVDAVDQPIPTAIGDTDIDVASWREDGRLLGIGRVGAEGPLAMRLLSDTAENAEKLLDLPVKPPNPYAAVWDGSGARLLVTSRSASGGLEFWLVQLGLEAN